MPGSLEDGGSGSVSEGLGSVEGCLEFLCLGVFCSAWFSGWCSSWGVFDVLSPFPIAVVCGRQVLVEICLRQVCQTIKLI